MFVDTHMHHDDGGGIFMVNGKHDHLHNEFMTGERAAWIMIRGWVMIRAWGMIIALKTWQTYEYCQLHDGCCWLEIMIRACFLRYVRLYMVFAWNHDLRMTHHTWTVHDMFLIQQQVEPLRPWTLNCRLHGSWCLHEVMTGAWFMVRECFMIWHVINEKTKDTATGVIHAVCMKSFQAHDWLCAHDAWNLHMTRAQTMQHAWFMMFASNSIDEWFMLRAWFIMLKWSHGTVMLTLSA